MSRQQITTLDITNGTVASADLAANLSLAGTVTTDAWELSRTLSNYSQLKTANVGFVCATAATHICANAYTDSAGAWQRFNTANPATLLIVTEAGSVVMYYAPAGANPIVWTKSAIRLGHANDVDAAWNTLTYVNGWSAWDPSQATWQSLSYRKDPMGYIHLAGLNKSPANTTYMNLSMAQLPAGARPSKYHQFACSVGTTQVAIWYVQPDGQITLQGIAPGTVAASNYYSVAGITFLAEA